MSASQNDRPALSIRDSLATDDARELERLAAPKRPQWLGILLASLSVGVGIAIGRVLPRSGAPAPTPATAPQSLPARAVETISLTPSGSSLQQVNLLGQVASRSSATIRPRTEGTVRDILVQPGDRVAAGTLLARLDDADQQLALMQARARLAEAESELARLEAGTRAEIVAQRRAALAAAKAREAEARDNLERNRALAEAGAIARRTLIEAETQVDASEGARLEAEATLAEAIAGPRSEDIDAQRATVAAERSAVEQAQLALQRTDIRAAATGTVQSRLASSGDYLEIGDPVLTTIDGDSLDIFLEIPEALGPVVTAGTPVNLSSRALPDWQQQIEIAAAVPAADPTSRRQQVRIQLDNPPADLVPGMAILGEISLPIRTGGFVVPRDALTARGSRWLVYGVRDDNTAREYAVEILADMGAKVAIAHPELQPGQAIVVQGGDGLKEGAPVKAIPVSR